MDRWMRYGLGAVLPAAVFGAGLLSAAQADDALCANPQEHCGARLDATCLARYGAGSVSATPSPDCAQGFAAYRDCLASVAETCGSGGDLNRAQQDAVESLEGLARLGGLIPDPTSIVEFYNNAFVYERRGDALNARRMYERAIAEGAEALDLHLRYAALLKAQEGLLGAREVANDIARRQPDNPAAALSAALLTPAPEREAALRALAASFAPAHYEISRLFSAERLGQQSLADQQAEKAALEAFVAADEQGRIYRWFLEKAFAEAWRRDARARLAVYDTRAVDIEPVALSAQASNDGWILSLSLVEPARAIRYSVDGGPINSTGVAGVVNPATGAPQPKTFFTLPLGVEQAAIRVWYDDVREREQGPFSLTFTAREAFVASTKNALGALNRWVQGREYDGRFLVYFTTLVSHRCGLSEVAYGVDRDTPDQTLPLAPCDPKNPYSVGDNATLYETFPSKIEKMSVRLTFADGEASELRVFTFD